MMKGIFMRHTFIHAEIAALALWVLFRPNALAQEFEIDSSNIVTLITSTDSFIDHPRWDPTGQKIAWTLEYIIDPYPTELWVADLTNPGNEVRLVQDSEEVRDAPIAWSPNGQFILYTTLKLQADPLGDRSTIGRASSTTPDSVEDDFLRPSDLGSKMTAMMFAPRPLL